VNDIAKQVDALEAKLRELRNVVAGVAQTVRRPAKTRCVNPSCPHEKRSTITNILAEVVIPNPGNVRGVVYRRIREDGTRDVDVALYVDGRWRMFVPLADVRGDEAFAVAVARADRFLTRQAVSA
jgi:hypothetical protein